MEQLRSRVRAFLDEVSPPAEVRRLMEDQRGYDLDVWLRLAADHDLLDLGGWPERAVVLEEAGRVLLCAPYLATVTAAPLVTPDVRDAIGGGLSIATIAIAEGSGRWDDAGVRTRAVKSPEGRWRLEGEKSYVVDGCAADVLVVAARTEDGAGDVVLFQVDGDAPGVDKAPLATVDTTRRLARVQLAAAPARRLEGSPATAMDLCAGALAAEQIGGAGRALEMAVEHAGRRIQFGRPIGSFQAVKHLCAEMLLELESARAAAIHAAGAVGTDGQAEASAVAKVVCSQAYVRIATDSLHVHGGLGFTWDHDAHLYLRRARSSLHLFGDPGHHRERLARHLGL